MDIIAQCTRPYARGRHAGESLPVNHGEYTGAWYYFRYCFVIEINNKAMDEYFIYDTFGFLQLWPLNLPLIARIVFGCAKLFALRVV